MDNSPSETVTKNSLFPCPQECVGESLSTRINMMIDIVKNDVVTKSVERVVATSSADKETRVINNRRPRLEVHRLLGASRIVMFPDAVRIRRRKSSHVLILI